LVGVLNDDLVVLDVVTNGDVKDAEPWSESEAGKAGVARSEGVGSGRSHAGRDTVAAKVAIETKAPFPAARARRRSTAARYAYSPLTCTNRAKGPSR